MTRSTKLSARFDDDLPAGQPALGPQATLAPAAPAAGHPAAGYPAVGYSAAGYPAGHPRWLYVSALCPAARSRKPLGSLL